jgi:uncharacterized protein YoxC
MRMTYVALAAVTIAVASVLVFLWISVKTSLKLIAYAALTTMLECTKQITILYEANDHD